MVIIWSDFAKSNLQDFIKYSKLSSPTIYANELVNAVSILEDNSRAGRKLSLNNNVDEIRQLIYKVHRIIYRISKSSFLWNEGRNKMKPQSTALIIAIENSHILPLPDIPKKSVILIFVPSNTSVVASVISELYKPESVISLSVLNTTV